jgi:hypothetical protein
MNNPQSQMVSARFPAARVTPRITLTFEAPAEAALLHEYGPPLSCLHVLQWQT